MGCRKSAVAIVGIAISLLAMAPAGAGEADKHARLVCSLTAKDLLGQVRAAHRSDVIQEKVRAAIKILAPEETPEAVLKRVQRVTGAIAHALYALPMEALEWKRTKEQALSICSYSVSEWRRQSLP